MLTAALITALVYAVALLLSARQDLDAARAQIRRLYAQAARDSAAQHARLAMLRDRLAPRRLPTTGPYEDVRADGRHIRLYRN